MIPTNGASRFAGGREDRRAPCSYALYGNAPQPEASGEGMAEVTDEGLTVGPLAVEHLDVDALTDEGRLLSLSLWPEGRLELSMLGRRHETFAQALSEARDEARVAGLLAHGISSPVVYPGALISGGPEEPAPGERRARFLVFPTHLTVIPEGGDPFQVPLGAITSMSFDEGTFFVRLETGPQAYVIGRLGRQTHMFRGLLKRAGDAQALRLAKASGTSRFADGAGVPLADLRQGERLLSSFSAPEREAGARLLLSLGERERARLGLVELLDPDREALAPNDPLPESCAAFLLVPAGWKVALEILSGPAAATYVFEGSIDALNRDLQALHFRRAPLALRPEDEEGRAGRPYRLALRRLEPLKRLRAATRARIVHAEGWEEKVRAALGGQL